MATTGRWYHVAIVRHNNVDRMYVDGSMVAENSSSVGIMPNLNNNLDIGIGHYW